MEYEIKENQRTLSFHQLHVLKSSRSSPQNLDVNHKFYKYGMCKISQNYNFDLLGGIKIAAFGLRV